MGEQSPLLLQLQLPPGTLEGLTRLVAELRYLAAALRSGETAAAMPSEAGVNPAFDSGRFQAMEAGGRAAMGGPASPPEAGEPILPLLGAAGMTAAPETRFSQVETPGSAGFPVAGKTSPPAGGAGRPAEETPPSAGAAPTLQTLSQALRRDERRYDSGFPLY